MTFDPAPLAASDAAVAALHSELERQARLPLALLPTPLHPLRRLSAHLGGPELWMKRDDLTGLGGGGNKVRKLEWLVADAIRTGADTLVTIGAVQSNHTRQTAAAAARAGLACTLIQERWVDVAEEDVLGNPLLSRLMGAEVRVVDGSFLPGAGEEPNARLDHVADDLRDQGRVPYVVPRGASDHPLGGLGYALCAAELVVQAATIGATPDAVVVAASSGSTQAGLIAGLAALGVGTPVIGIEVNADIAMTHSIVTRLTHSTAERLGADGADLVERVHTIEGYAGEAYGLLSPDGLEAIRLVGRLEGIVLDPVYEGKSMAGLLGLVCAGALDGCERVIFMNLGGDPALHAYRSALLGRDTREK